MVDELLVGVIPDNWEYTTLGTACERGGGNIQTGPFGSQLHAADYVSDGVPSIMPQNIGDNRIVEKGISRITSADAQRLSRYLVQKNDIVYSRRGDVERRALVREREDGWLCGTGCLRVRFGEKCVDPRYASFYLGHPNVREWIVRHAHGATMPNLNTSILAACPFVIPPLSEQQTIAQILGTLDDKIELNQRMSDTLDRIAKVIFKSWFVDFDPVHAKAEGRSTGLPKQIADIFPDSFEDSELGEIPNGWCITDLPDAIEFLEGPGLRNWQYRDVGMKFLNIRCIINGDLDIAKANAISLEEFEKTYSHFALREDDIVISTSGTLGRLAIVRPDHLPVMLNTSIIRMRGRDPVGLVYVWNFLQSAHFLEEMFALAAGSVQLNFGPMHLKKIKLLRPPDFVLKHFEKFTLPLIRKALYNRSESHAIASIRNTVLPKLISGTLRVKDAERFIGKHL